MRVFPSVIAVCLLLTTVMCAGAAHAEITGAAEWNWTEYRRDLDSGGSTSLSQFYQQYSLLYRDRQTFRGGRAGGWSVALGYEWSALDLSGSLDEGVDTGKLLYQGELSFTPVGLPFSLYAYSSDLTRSSPVTQNLPDTIIDPDVYVGIRDGQHFSSGLTLVVGESQPYYSPRSDFKAVLTTLPRLMLDYSEEYVRDLKGHDPTHYRTRDLAFVTLNRKKNWFHYRVYEHADFIDPGNDFEEQTVLLGTIDHLYRRQWINLTNWLSISADGSLTKSKGDARRLYGAGNELYQLNLFSNARRRDWSFANYTSLTRDTYDSGFVKKNFEFPLFATGQSSPEKKWKAAFIAERLDEQDPSGKTYVLNRKEDDLYAKGQLENRQAAGMILTYRGDAEWFKTSRFGTAYAARLGLEARGKDVGRNMSWLAGYSLAHFETDPTAAQGGNLPNGDGGTYDEHVATASVDFRLSPTVSAGGSQVLIVGFGNTSANSMKNIGTVLSDSVFATESRGHAANDDTAYRSTTGVYLELTPPGRWRNRFSADYDFLHTSANKHQFKAEHHLTYLKDAFRLGARTTFVEGDDLYYPWTPEGIGMLEAYTGRPDMYLAHETSVSYDPNRSWQNRLAARVIWGHGDRGDGWLLGVEQSMQYHLYKTDWLMRRWFTLEQKFEHQQIFNDGTAWRSELEFWATWYINNVLTLDAMVGIRRYGITSQTEYEFQTSAKTVFRKLEARLAYAYGQIDAWDTDAGAAWLPGSTEQRWEVSLKKYF